MHQVAAARVAQVRAIEVDQAVGVVGLVFTRGKVVLGTVRLVEGGRLAEGTGAGE
jgi:hypothetical protein